LLVFYRREHVCGEYGLRGVGCGDRDMNWNNGLGMPPEWGCNMVQPLASATGWSNFLTFESDYSSGMVRQCCRVSDRNESL